MTIFEIIIIWIFAVSLIANFLYVIFNQQMGRYTFRWDLFRWISSYQLFSFVPRCFELYYRDKLSNEEMTEWKKIEIVAPRRWFHPVFFPESLTYFDIYSFVDDLVRLQELNKKPELIRESFTYKTVFQYLRRFPSSANAVARQFKIEETQGFFSDDEQQQQRFISKFHSK